MLKKFNQSAKNTKSYMEIKKEWEKILLLDIRNRYKAMRAISSDVCDIFTTNDFDTEQLEFYINILKQVNQIHNIPKCKRVLSKMISTWLDLKGYADAKVIKKIAGKINLVTAGIAIGEPSCAQKIRNVYADSKNILNLINQGQAYIFSTGSDGLHNVQVRIVDSEEPILSSKEYKCVEDATETAIIDVYSGKLAISDPCLLDNDNERMLIKIEPGKYKIAVYFFYIRSKVESFYIVLCKADKEAINHLSKLPTFNT